MVQCVYQGFIVRAIVLTLTFTTVVHSSAYKGCWEENVRRRQFQVTIGSYRPEDVTQEYCMTKCGLFDFAYAGLTDGKFCFCSSSLPSGTAVADANCNIPCVGDTGQMCGGRSHVGVYESLAAIGGLEITSDANDVMEAPAVVVVNATVTEGEALAWYQIDYDDGAGFSILYNNGYFTGTFYLPGDYRVAVQATDALAALGSEKAVTSVLVEEGPQHVDIECDPLFGTYMEGQCHVTVWRGSNLNLEVDIIGKLPSAQIYAVLDPRVELTGMWHSKPSGTANSVDTARSILLVSTAIGGDGRMYGIRAHVMRSGPVTFMVLTPTCATGSYCLASNRCQVSCSSMYSTTETSCPVNKFCMQENTCTGTCSAPVPRYGDGTTIPVDSYKVTHVVTHTFLTTGEDFLTIDPPLDVQPGDILGIDEDGTPTSGKISVEDTTSDDDVAKTHQAPTLGLTFPIAGSSSFAARHVAQPLVSFGSKTSLKYTLTGATGIFPINITVYNKRGFGTPSTNSTDIQLDEGIDVAIILGPRYVIGGTEAVYTAATHTGTASYNWTVSNVQISSGVADELRHTFPAPGHYNVSLAVYNYLGFKENVTDVYVQDKIEGLSITTEARFAGLPSDINITIASGTIHMCSIFFGDTSPEHVYASTLPSVLEVYLQHTYTAIGTYTISVNCSNDLSSNSSTSIIYIEEPISNLRLDTLGAPTMGVFRLVWRVDTGSSIDFLFTFNGNPVVIDVGLSDPSIYRWESTLMSGLPANGYPYEINATNRLNSEVISGTFIVLDPIINPTFISDLDDVTTDDTVTFTIDMASGSDVSIEVIYYDGLPNDTFPPASVGAPWTGPKVFTHKFGNGCNCKVTALISNAAGSFTRYVDVLVKVGFSRFTWDFPDEKYYLYDPPALIDYSMTLIGPLPTDPTYSLNWGDGSPVEVTDTIAVSPDSYRWQFDDTEDYLVQLEMSNQFSSVTFSHKAIVVEKLVGPKISLEFPSAPLNKPFHITFSLFRGDQGNLTVLTWDFGDGNAPTTTERQGVGEDGEDTLAVTYTTLGSKTVTVTAVAPLGQLVTASETFDVINGVDHGSVTVTTNGDRAFGAPSTFTITYSSLPLPDTASIAIDWYGDGSVISLAQPFTIGAAGGSQTITFNYPLDGLHKAKVIITNDASEVVQESQAGVYKPFVNLKSEVSYTPDSELPNPTPLLGLNGIQQHYPLDKSVYFKMSDDNNAFTATYDVTSIAQPTGGAVLETFTENNFHINFTLEGTYRLRIEARNPINSAAVIREIEMVRRVKNLNISEEMTHVSPGLRKNFNVTFEGYGADTCVYVDWGDLGAKTKYGNDLSLCTDAAYASAEDGGDMADLTEHLIGYKYLREGIYKVNIQAISLFGSENASIEFPISYSVCSTPELSIHNQETTVFFATKHRRSQIIRVLGLANINCPDSLQNQKKWKLEMVDEESGDPLPFPSVDVSGLEVGKAELYIPARYLEVGVYMATYQMTMTAVDTGVDFVTETSTYFKILESDLIGMMVEGGLTETTMGTSQTLTLAPLVWSMDPDIDPSITPQGLSVVGWGCEVLDTTDQSACEQIATHSVSTQAIQGSMWTEGMRYKLKVNLQKGTRQALTQLIILVNGTNPRQVYIKCARGSVCYQKSYGYLGLASSRMAIECDCKDCSATAQYKWEIFIEDYRWPERWRPIREGHLVDKSITTDDETCGYSDQSCIFSKALALQTELFDAYKHVADKYRAQCVVRDGSVITQVATNIIINQPPVDGNCSITPLVASVTVDNAKQWEVYCWGWKDVDGIKDYQMTSFFHEYEVEKEITSNPTTWSGFFAQVALPIGPAYRDYEQDIYVYVRDSQNAVTRMKIATVTVHPPSDRDSRNYLARAMEDDNHDFYKQLHEGDQRSVCELITAASITMGHSAAENEKEFGATCLVPTMWLNTGYGPTTGPREMFTEVPTGPYIQAPEDMTMEQQFAYDSIRHDRAKMKSKLIDFLVNMTKEDISSIQQVSGALAELTSNPTEINMDKQGDILDDLDVMIASLGDPVKMKNVPQEDIQKAMNNIYTTIGAIVDASGSSGNFPTFDDMEAAKNDSSWKEYDTSNTALDDGTDLSHTKSYEEAMMIHTLRIHKKISGTKSSETTDHAYAVMDKMARLFQTFAIPGQVQEATGYRTKYRLEMNFAKSYLGKDIGIDDSAASITFPKSIAVLFPSGTVADSDVITLQVVQNTNTAMRSSTNALKYFPEDSQTHFVSVDFYDESQKRLSLPETKEQIRIVIPNDPNAPKPEKRVVHPLVTDWNRFMFHTTEVPNDESDMHLSFEIVEDTQLVVVVKHDGVPDPSTNNTDFIFVIPETLTPGTASQTNHTIALDKTMLNGRVGKWMFGVIERNVSFINAPVPTNSEVVERYKNGSGEFSSYNLTIFLTGCFYYRQGTEDWATDGCLVSHETTPAATVCLCTHLTTFAGGLIVAPNTIDWNYVFSNFDFLSNPTLYVTEIVVFLAFMAGFIMARRKDITDVSKRGLAPLPDNNITDKYMYEIIVSTGLRRNAGTESKVFFIMSGEEDETDIRVLSDTKREILKRGMTNGFLMAVPECLGRIQYIRMWHDNSGEGKFGSWFLNYIAVKDLQKDTKQVFILNRWLAVEEDDGLVDRIIPLAGKEQLSDFSYQFGERSKKNLLDDHLWFSLVARPPGSRFSCVERVACCMCLLFMTMMANAMFYNVQENSNTSTSTSFDIGPFSLSVAQLSIGFISTIIVFPANFLLVFLFRKSKSRTITASKSKNSGDKPDGILSPSHIRVRQNSQASTSSDESKTSGTSSTKLTAGKRVSGGHVKQKSTSCQLPWWCVIIAWMLLIVLTLGSAAIVTFYGITFGDETCRQWIASLLFSFLTSIFVTQPVKVILVAIFLSLIVKNPEEEDDDEDGVGQEVVVEDDKRTFLHAEYLTGGGEGDDYMAKEPPTRKELEQIREQRVKEVKMWAVIREIFFYFLFLWILMVIAHRNRSSDNFHYKNSMHRTFIKSLDTKIPFNKIKTESDFWLWAKSGLTGGLLAGSYYNDYPPLRLRTYINDKASRILGHAVLRQNRIIPNRCDLSEYFKDRIDECNTMYEFSAEEKRPFDIGWAPLGTSQNGTAPEYKYSTAESLDGYPYWGYRGIYSGGGYVAHLNGSKQAILGLMTRLENERWIDRLTRSVFVEFTVYNPQVNLFSMNLLLAEFDTTNGIVTSHRFEPAMLLPYMSGTMVFQLICEIAFLIYLLIFLVSEMKNLFQQRLRYFTHFWNWVELCIIGVSTGAVVIYFYRLYETNRLTKEFKRVKGNEYIKFQFVSYWNEIFAYLIGFIVFFGTLKFLKLLRFNQRVSMLSNTMKYSSKSLLHFGVIAFIVFLAFVQLFFLTYMNVDENYSSFIESVVASILMMMGKFNIYVMIMAKPIITQIFVLGFVLAMTFIIVNMFVSILNDAFSEVRGNLHNQTNEYEIIEFIMERFQRWVGVGATAANNKNGQAPPNGRDNFNETGRKENFDDDSGPCGAEMQMFPERIERLLQSLSAATTANNAAGSATVFNKLRVGERPSEWDQLQKKPYSAPKSALEEFFPRRHTKKEIRRLSLARVDTE